MSELPEIVVATAESEGRRYRTWINRIAKYEREGKSTAKTQRLVDRYLAETRGYWLLKLSADRQRAIGFSPDVLKEVRHA